MTESNLLPAYLVNGEDELKRETVLKRLRARMDKLGDMDFNSDTFDGVDAVGADIVTACNTMPCASEARLVVVRNADALTKADSEAVVEYLASPSPTTVLALVARKLAKNTRLYKAVDALGKQAVIDCAPKKAYDLSRSTTRALVVWWNLWAKTPSTWMPRSKSLLWRIREVSPSVPPRSKRSSRAAPR